MDSVLALWLGMLAIVVALDFWDRGKETWLLAALIGVGSIGYYIMSVW